MVLSMRLSITALEKSPHLSSVLVNMNNVAMTKKQESSAIEVAEPNKVTS